MEFWRSSGGFHFWHPGQTKPGTEWERQIDELMTRQAAALDVSERRQLFSQAQKLLAEHEPVVVFAVPRVFVAASKRVGNVTPAVQRPQLLWSPDTLSVTAAR
jgi:peptide/nickel transport system substrate-binding protein